MDVDYLNVILDTFKIKLKYSYEVFAVFIQTYSANL